MPYLIEIESLPLVRLLQRNRCNTRENIAKLYLYPDFIDCEFTHKPLNITKTFAA